MTLPLGLIGVLVVLAIIITVLMRPDIFFSILRGGREKNNAHLPHRAVSDKEFQSRLKEGNP